MVLLGNDKKKIKKTKKEQKEVDNKLKQNKEKQEQIKKLKAGRVKALDNEYTERRVDKQQELKLRRYLEDNTDFTNDELKDMDIDELEKERENVFNKRSSDIFDGIKIQGYNDTPNEDTDNLEDDKTLKEEEEQLKKESRKLKTKERVQKTKRNVKRAIKGAKNMIVFLVTSLGGIVTFLVIIVAVLIMSFGVFTITVVALDVIKADVKADGALGDEKVVKLTKAEKGDLTGMLGDYEKGKGVPIFPRGNGHAPKPSNKNTKDDDKGGTLKGDNNPERVWNFLRQKGYSEEATAGIMGNIQQESGENFDSTAVNPSSGAFGIVQWLGGRKDNLYARASEKGVEPTDLNLQLEYMDWEFMGGDTTSVSFLKENNTTPEEFKKLNNVERTAELFDIAFERSGGGERSTRISNSQAWLEKYKGH